MIFVSATDEGFSHCALFFLIYNLLKPSSERGIAFLFTFMGKHNKIKNLSSCFFCVSDKLTSVCVCFQVRKGSRYLGGEQGGLGKREGGIIQRRSGSSRGVGLPVHGDLG